MSGGNPEGRRWGLHGPDSFRGLQEKVRVSRESQRAQVGSAWPSSFRGLQEKDGVWQESRGEPVGSARPSSFGGRLLLQTPNGEHAKK